jgi:hypothetical protein
MTSNFKYQRHLSLALQWSLIIVAVVAVVLGLYGRFKGLGRWPLGIDEFYSSRSIDNVLRTGLPKFLCGGYYNRGVLYQYIVALLRLNGLSPEFSGRFVAAVSSVAVLPAAYILGRRVAGRGVGLLAVIILALSVWEIEMARFARMYAPFQAVFAWYLVFFLRYVVDGDRKALVWMVVLSLVGVMTWEGGALLGLANMLPPLLNHDRGRLRRADWPYLGWMLLFAIVLYLLTRDLRGFASTPPSSGGEDANPLQVGDVAQQSFWPFHHHLGWLVLYGLPLSLSVASAAWIWSLRDRSLTALGCGATLLSAALHQFLLCGAILVLMLLTRLIAWRDLSNRSARLFGIALLACGVYWLAFGLATDAWHTAPVFTSSTANKLLAIARNLLGYPNVLEEVLRPWVRAMPAMMVGLLIALTAMTIRTIALSRGGPTVVSALLVVTLIMTLAVGATSTDRIEARYTFFLYPLAITLAVATFAAFGDFLVGDSTLGLPLAGLASLLCFGLSEDFQLKHITQVDTAAVNFRIGMPLWRRQLYYSRSDFRLVAEWLNTHVHDGDIVMSGIPNVDQYYPRTDFFFLDENDERYETYACSDGRTERWTNRPLLYSTEALRPQIATGRRIFLVLYPGWTETVLAEAQARGWQHELAWSLPNGGVQILLFNSPPSSPPVADISAP